VVDLANERRRMINVIANQSLAEKVAIMTMPGMWRHFFSEGNSLW
jgi:hypothetical protein